ncbi:hypothetical protein SCHPADRAFT_932264 [Schizopora paradoxa]|uniref:Uncharacterized protein n=1 Tax=Schizopora paradoxa TaxID=27342 RepID=A0A0H2R753_9AGAM|nr:hypothetical protein SCHPADRAFT_932264 [Schizopora paradoxa]
MVVMVDSKDAKEFSRLDAITGDPAMRNVTGIAGLPERVADMDELPIAPCPPTTMSTTPTAMNAKPKDADGDRVYDPQLERWIQYQSRSDALLANLHLQHGFRLDQLDLVLKMLQDPGFDMEKISINTPTDVLRTISLDEEKLAHERTKPELNWELKGPGMPQVVFDLVMDTLKENLGSFSFDEDVKYHALSVVATKKKTKAPVLRPSHSTRLDLVNMTLVHRTWTPEVRKILRRRVVIRGPNQLVSFLRSAYSGPHVLELILHLNEEFADDKYFSNCSSLLAGLFSYCRNIYSISLILAEDTNRATSSEATSSSGFLVGKMMVVIKHAVDNMAAHLPHLERLWLIAESVFVPASCWYGVFNALGRLNSLQSLCFAGKWGNSIDPLTSKLIENMKRISPPSSLKTIIFHPSRFSVTRRIPPEVLTWLFLPSPLKAEDMHPLASPTIQNIVIPLGDAQASLLFGKTPEAQQAIANMWASVQSLDCSSSSLHCVRQAMELCSSLRELTIDVELFWKLAEGQLPSTLEHLVLTFHDLAFIPVHDKAAVEVLERSVKKVENGGPGSAMLRNLRRVDFRIHEYLLEKKKLASRVNQDGVVVYYIDSSKCMDQTSLACHALGVKFKVYTFLAFLEPPKTSAV